ncbi:DegV family protein [Vallitalea pronyensis]|uniref:DegV family protein n=1 Tax=Vallitalea pronyensis TaxID=1348613 RepID=A0A8J8SG80_9FIRM|nr:DegV family protein [Vallitalea pronyensis]QUI22033.1 DegV family protein [Vallitalea pronyensis]
MDYKIIVDSGCDVDKEMIEEMSLKLVPLTIEFEGDRHIDDDTFDGKTFVKKMNLSHAIPKTACPSPAEYMDSYQGKEDNVFVVTLSSKLSGSYNSAEVAKEIYEGENRQKKIHVFDSLSASAGQVLLTLKVDYLAKMGKTYSQIVSSIEQYIKEMKTIFVLEKLDNLVKTGRMSLVKAAIANVLNIKLILASNGKGEIIMLQKARGIKKAINKMIEIIDDKKVNLEEKFLVIAHCNCVERAMAIKEKAKVLYGFKDIFVVEMRGISSVYANDGGIVIAY